MLLAGILEWILGNTFPFVVFTTFGGFWFFFAVLNDPSVGVAAAYTALDADVQQYEGLAVYFVVWGILVFI